jgi:transcriptional regulator with XRE-family HTH domain
MLSNKRKDVKPASHLALLRKSRGLTQEELAEVCGLSLRAVQRIEAGETSPRPYTIRVIAQALGVPVDDLANNTGRLSHTVPEENKLSELGVVNFSAMSGLIIPFANVFVPILLAKRYGNLKREPQFKRIISFQAFWSLVTVLAIVLTPLLIKLFTQTVAFGKLPPPILLTYAAMILLNAYFTIRSAVQLRQGAPVYSWVPQIF